MRAPEGSSRSMACGIAAPCQRFSKPRMPGSHGMASRIKPLTWPPARHAVFLVFGEAAFASRRRRRRPRREVRQGRRRRARGARCSCRSRGSREALAQPPGGHAARTRASPMRIASISARRSPSSGSRSARPRDCRGQRSEPDATLASVGVGPDGRQVALACEFVGQRRCRPRRRDATGLAVELWREQVLDRMDQELLGLAEVRAPALEVMQPGGLQALQRAMHARTRQT